MIKLTNEFILTLLLFATACKDIGAVTGDKIYIEEGYQQQLVRLNLTEVAALPYFTKPFICLAKDEKGAQYAVVFRSAEKVDTTKLPVSYESILTRVKEERHGDIMKENLHLFEINNQLVWSFTDGKGTMYMDLKGDVLTDPFKQSL
ncbi:MULTISPECIES: hypothetical protein [unclassified Paenibacillus]|uniref:hypothetical protein n=1 Tax=unclassified Paenibacillus TaxID=185978 RepID=UPI0027D8BF38|nr:MULTISPECIES: hypothetical protein [unclassified Paenibacillus]